jgi:hypothetical protein
MTTEVSRDPRHNPPAVHCVGKQSFDSPSLALAVSKRKTRRNSNSMQAYHCPSCRKWHLGSRRPDFDRKGGAMR